MHPFSLFLLCLALGPSAVAHAAPSAGHASKAGHHADKQKSAGKQAGRGPATHDGSKGEHGHEAEAEAEAESGAGRYDDDGKTEEPVKGEMGQLGAAATSAGALDGSPPELAAPPTATASAAPEPAHRPAGHDGAGRWRLWHDTPAVAGSIHSHYAQLSLNGGGTIVASQPSYSIAQAGMFLRLAHFVRKNMFVAGDVELGGGAGSAPGIDRLFFNVGAAFGAYFPVHKNLDLLPSIGLGYNLWYADGGNGANWLKHALQIDLRLGVASPLTDRWSLVVTPYLQTNVVHRGSGPREGLHVSLGLSAGVVAWL